MRAWMEARSGGGRARRRGVARRDSPPSPLPGLLSAARGSGHRPLPPRAAGVRAVLPAARGRGPLPGPRRPAGRGGRAAPSGGLWEEAGDAGRRGGKARSAATPLAPDPGWAAASVKSSPGPGGASGCAERPACRQPLPLGSEASGSGESCWRPSLGGGALSTAPYCPRCARYLAMIFGECPHL